MTQEIYWELLAWLFRSFLAEKSYRSLTTDSNLRQRMASAFSVITSLKFCSKTQTRLCQASSHPKE